jgi:hypothetical protein
VTRTVTSGRALGLGQTSKIRDGYEASIERARTGNTVGWIIQK